MDVNVRVRDKMNVGGDCIAGSEPVELRQPLWLPTEM
jgi:hypothetical protein